MPKPSITWLHGGNKVENSEEFAYENSGDTYKLIIAEVFPEDAGVYCCEASNEAGRTSCCCTLKVVGKYITLYFCSSIFIIQGAQG